MYFQLIDILTGYTTGHLTISKNTHELTICLIVHPPKTSWNLGGARLLFVLICLFKKYTEVIFVEHYCENLIAFSQEPRSGTDVGWLVLLDGASSLQGTQFHFSTAQCWRSFIPFWPTLDLEHADDRLRYNCPMVLSVQMQLVCTVEQASL